MGLPAGKNTGVGCRFLLQGIFPTQGSNQSLLHWQVDAFPTWQAQYPFHLYVPNTEPYTYQELKNRYREKGINLRLKSTFLSEEKTVDV